MFFIAILFISNSVHLCFCGEHNLAESTIYQGDGCQDGDSLPSMIHTDTCLLGWITLLQLRLPYESKTKYEFDHDNLTETLGTVNSLFSEKAMKISATTGTS